MTKQSSLTNITLIVMSTLTAIAWLVLPQGFFLWLWHKFQKPFAWISHFDDDNIIHQTHIYVNNSEQYHPIDTDEGEVSNPYGLDKDDNATFQWDEDFFGNN